MNMIMKVGVAVAVVLLVFLAVKLDMKVMEPAKSSAVAREGTNAVTNAVATNAPVFDPNGYYGAYEPMAGKLKVRRAITVSKFATYDNTASMGCYYPKSVGLYDMSSNLMAVCAGSNWWWYAEMSATSLPLRCFFRFDDYYTYYINDSSRAQYKIYPAVKQ